MTDLKHAVTGRFRVPPALSFTTKYIARENGYRVVIVGWVAGRGRQQKTVVIPPHISEKMAHFFAARQVWGYEHEVRPNVRRVGITAAESAPNAPIVNPQNWEYSPTFAMSEDVQNQILLGEAQADRKTPEQIASETMAAHPGRFTRDEMSALLIAIVKEARK